MLRGLSVEKFVRQLSSDSPAPGGGSAAALAGAMAAGLAGMVARLTIGKKKFVDVEKEMMNIAAEADKSAKLLSELIDRDTEAYLRLSQAFRMPKQTDEEKRNRSNSIREASIYAAQVPLETLVEVKNAALLLNGAARHGNPNCSSDIGTGAALAQAAAHGAYRNVAINLEGMKQDDQTSLLASRALKLREEILGIANEATAILDRN